MILKHVSDHIVVSSPTCGEVREIITQADNYAFGIAICPDIKPTEGHFHHNFDETYFVLDGEISLEIFDPKSEQKIVYRLKANELYVVFKGLHHKIIYASEKNRLCVISSPPFQAGDEHPSNKI